MGSINYSRILNKTSTKRTTVSRHALNLDNHRNVEASQTERKSYYVVIWDDSIFAGNMSDHNLGKSKKFPDLLSIGVQVLGSEDSQLLT